MIIQRSAWLPQKKPSIPRIILETFRERIVSGQYAPGARMPTIRELSAEFGVAMSSVREAIRALEMVGLVEIRQGDGIYVAAADSEFASVPLTWGLLLTGQTQQELVQVRFILEVAAAELAAQNASPADHDAMRKAIDNLRDEYDPNAAANADLDFHLAVTHASGNRILERLLQGTRELLRPLFVKALARGGIKDRVSTYHQSILDAIVDRASDRARLAMTAHLSFVADIWLGPAPTNADSGGAFTAHKVLE